MEVKAVLWRIADGKRIDSCVFSYRSQDRRFMEWAANDAQLFQQELDQAHRQLGDAIVDRLVSQGFVAPNRLPVPVWASNSN